MVWKVNNTFYFFTVSDLVVSTRSSRYKLSFLGFLHVEREKIETNKGDGLVLEYTLSDTNYLHKQRGGTWFWICTYREKTLHVFILRSIDEEYVVKL